MGPDAVARVTDRFDHVGVVAQRSHSEVFWQPTGLHLADEVVFQERQILGAPAETDWRGVTLAPPIETVRAIRTL